MFYRWLTPITSSMLGGAVALIATPLLVSGKGGEADRASGEAKSAAVIQAAGDPESSRPSASEQKPIPGLSVEEFVRELNEILELPRSFARDQQMGNLFELAPSSDALGLGRAIIAGIESTKFGVDLSQIFNHFLHRRLPDRERFLFFVNEWPKSGLSAPLNDGFDDWMRDDPESAIAWLEELRRDKAFGKLLYNGRALASDFLRTISSHALQTGGMEAALALKIEWVNSGDADLDIWSLGLESESDYRMAWEAVRKVEAPGARSEGLRSLASRMASKHFSAAQEVIEAVADPRERTAYVRQIIIYSFRKIDWDREQPADWCLEQTMDSRRDFAFGQIASRWVFDDPDAAFPWIERHPERHSAVSLEGLGTVIRQENYAGQPTRLSPEKLAERAELIPRIHAIWNKRDPAAAEAFQDRSLEWLHERGFAGE